MNTGPLTAAEEFAITVNAKVTLPSRRCTDPKFVYVTHEHTDLRKVFERLMEVDFNDDEAYRRRRDAEIARTAPAWFKEAA